MKQQPFAPICNCCGLSIRPGLGEDCPRCHYPLNPSKEEQFLRASLQDLQRVAAYGGANITVSNLISRYHARLAFLQNYQAGVLPQNQPATPQVSAAAANGPLAPQEAKPEGKTFVLPVTPPEIKPSPVTFVRSEEGPQNIPPVALPKKAEAIPAPVARAAVQTREPRRTVWQSFRQAWRSFVVDQAITLI
ncbi:MAG TPA: hypothetical protein VFN23_00205, partial [Ktedonobacteraceae bacterium]|nr:hypothetical protein [Ktedonobacteraceae bacterium]